MTHNIRAVPSCSLQPWWILRNKHTNFRYMQKRGSPAAIKFKPLTPLSCLWPGLQWLIKITLILLVIAIKYTCLYLFSYHFLVEKEHRTEINLLASLVFSFLICEIWVGGHWSNDWWGLSRGNLIKFLENLNCKVSK